MRYHSCVAEPVVQRIKTFERAPTRMRIAKEVPIAEITLRKYEKPYKLQGRELVKKLCLSIGLLQPGDSRDVVVDVLHAIARAERPLSSERIIDEIKAARTASGLPPSGAAPSNVRRQLKRMRQLFLIERQPEGYRIAEGAPLPELFEEKLEKFYIKSITERVKEYFSAMHDRGRL
jgi:hypothetical protein